MSNHDVAYTNAEIGSDIHSVLHHWLRATLKSGSIVEEKKEVSEKKEDTTSEGDEDEEEEDSSDEDLSLALQMSKEESPILTQKKEVSSVLIQECTTHLLESTKPVKRSNIRTYESLHPVYPICDYSVDVQFEGVKALRVTFDERCETKEDCVLTFYSDSSLSESKKIARFVGKKNDENQCSWRAFVIHSDSFTYRLRGSRRVRDHENMTFGGWGFRFSVSPVSGLQWNSELEVLTDPSLEWACWVLEFVLCQNDNTNDQRVDIRTAVHTPEVFDALVRYLRTHGAPYVVLFSIHDLYTTPYQSSLTPTPYINQVQTSNRASSHKNSSRNSRRTFQEE
jgi:hypothetical protein